MTAEEKSVLLGDLAILEEAQFLVIWSCFSSDAQKDEAIKKLDELRGQRWQILETPIEPKVIENTKEPIGLSDPEECKLLGLLRDLMFFDDMSYDYWRAFCLQVAALGKPVYTLTLGELSALASRRKSA